MFTPLEAELHDTNSLEGVDIDTIQQMERLRRFIATEPPFDRALLLLYLEDKPQKEIAEIALEIQTLKRPRRRYDPVAGHHQGYALWLDDNQPQDSQLPSTAITLNISKSMKLVRRAVF